MKKIMMLLSVVLSIIPAPAQQSIEITDWQMQDSVKVTPTTGEAISASSFVTTDWYKATVPGTVLGTLVDQKVFSDPMYGDNMYKIPDIAKEQRRYWFRATFNVTFSAGQRVWLEFGGINYFATIFCNGKQVGTMYGAFKEAKFDITDKAVSGVNYLAVKIRGNYTPGEYHTQRQSGSCGGNGGVMSADGPTFIASQGWDWIPTIPDRDMGIWKPVYVRVTGPVVIRHPWIRTTNVSAASATVPLQVMLRNTTGTAVSGKLEADINNTVKFEAKTVTVPVNDTINVDFSPITMTNPKLWWPNGYGDPNLYTCHISFTPDGAALSDTVQFKFGVRQYSFSTAGGSLIISCNGQRILARGGNWGMDDAMKKWNLHRLEAQVRYHKKMNFNIIRDWIGMTDREPFYDFCDRYGQMVWSDFWLPHDADGPKRIDDKPNYIANMQDKIYRVRNHACIVLWCAQNETEASYFPECRTALTNFHTILDGTRMVLNSSGTGPVHSGGPYTYTSPTNIVAVIKGFHTELGGQAPPSFESMSAMLPAESQWPMSNNGWSFHDWCVLNANPKNYTDAMTSLFGTSSSLKEFCMKAQIMNYDNYRAYLEGLQVKRFNGATGLLLWMSNPVWPSLVWQPYDYYLEGTGGMYGAQKGSEPIHVMYYGSGTYNVSVVNNTMSPLTDYSVSARTYNIDGSKVWEKTAAVTVAADAINSNVLGSGITAGASVPYFLDLKLKDADGKIVSKNLYWVPNSGSNIGAMLTMAKATLKQAADATISKTGAEYTISFQVINSSAVCAIACRLLLTKATSGARILPVHYNDNYFCLAPGDTQSVEVKFDDVDKGEENPKLCITGVNVAETCIPIPQVSSRRDGVGNGVAMGMHIRCTGNTLRICAIGAGKTWNFTLFDLNGREVLNKRGGGKSGALLVSTAGLHCGAYVATITSAGELYRTLVTIAK